MAISINSVIHYTNKIENLKGIISRGGFKIKYCNENLNIQRNPNINSALPMVSFCDIPLSEVKNHINVYGSYGIGLTKKWAKDIGLNPVLYIEKKSRIAKNLREQLDRIFDIRKEKRDEELEKEFINFLSYCKNYEGPLKRGNIDSNKYRFYDEREWRLIPSNKELKGAPKIIQGDRYLKNKGNFNLKIENCLVKFSFKDISYIIIKSENEIPKMLTVLNEVFENKCTSKELKILSTKLITINQIRNDF